MKISRVKAPWYNGGWKVAKIDTSTHAPGMSLTGFLFLTESPSNKIPLGLHGNNNHHNNNNPEVKRKKGKIYTRDARAQELASGNKTFFCGAPAGPTGWRPDRLLVSVCVCVCAGISLGTARHTLTWVIIGRQDVVNLYTLCTLTSGRRISVFFFFFFE